MQTAVAELLLKKYGKKNPPVLRTGDTVRVHQRIKEGDKERVQVFEGLVIATRHGNSLDGTFTVRKIAAGGVGVERTYPLHSPNVLKVERVRTADVRRAKLYYMRDRKGKSARFKSESASPMSWIEPEAQPAEELPEEETVEAAEPAVDAQPEAEVVEEAPAEQSGEETPAEEAATEEPAA